MLQMGCHVTRAGAFVCEHVRLIQAVLQGLEEWFVRKADVGLMEADEPEKARKLAKMLSAFLHVGNGGAADSLDV